MLTDSIRQLVNGAVPSPSRGRPTRRKPSFSGDEPEKDGPQARTKRNRRTRRSKEPESDPISPGNIAARDTQEVFTDHNSSKRTGDNSTTPGTKKAIKVESNKKTRKKRGSKQPSSKATSSKRTDGQSNKCTTCKDSHTAAQAVAIANSTTIQAPARTINAHTGTLNTLVLDPHMPAYHGSKPIPDAIRQMRDYIKNECFKVDGNIDINKARAKYKNKIRTDGRVPKGQPLKEFWMDLRLFTAPMWERLMTEWRKAGWRNHAELYDFQGKLAGAVLPPPNYDYDEDLFPRKKGEEEEGEEEEEDADANVDAGIDEDDEVDVDAETVIAAGDVQAQYESTEEARSRVQFAAEDAARDKELDEMNSDDDVEMEDADASGSKKEAN